MIRARPLLALGVLFGLCSTAHAQASGNRLAGPWAGTVDDADLEIKLVTFGPGDAIHQYWGHDALIVQDKRRRHAEMYNFGMFGFGSDMLPKYLRGKLTFWVEAMPVRVTLQRYAAANRSVTVRELDLPPERRRYLAERLAWYAAPQNRFYQYEHYTNNCTTKLRDLIDEALDGQFHAQFTGPARLDYRGHTRRYTEHDPIVHFLLILWMNDSMERSITRYDEAFLPDELEHLVDEATYQLNGRTVKLVKLAYTVYQAHRPPVPDVPSRAWPGLLALGLGIGLLGAGLGYASRHGARAPRVVFGLYESAVGFVFGIPGLVLGLFLATGWQVTHWNENLWIASPLTFLAFPLGFAVAFGRKRPERLLAAAFYVLAACSLILIVAKLLPNFDQANLEPMVVYIPLNLGFAVAHYLRRPLTRAV